MNYYNEWDKYAVSWLRNLIDAGHLPAGEVDERSITDVSPGDLAGFTQCHFFAGIGGWSLAARLAGWPEDRELWTGSPPCQPFSVAGKQLGQDDSRHLWPHYFRLIAARRPAVLMGEQVAAAVGKNWLDGVHADLEGIGYSCGAAVVPACAVNAPHRRDRLWFVADAVRGGQQMAVQQQGSCVAADCRAEQAGIARSGSACCAMADTDIARASEERQQRSRQLGGAGGDPGACGCSLADSSCGRCGEPGARQVQQPRGTEAVGRSEARSAWDGAGWIIGHDGKARRVGTRIRRVADGLSAGMAGLRAGQESAAEIQGHGGRVRDAVEIEMIPLLAHGVLARVGKLRAFGNAIVPAVAAEVIAAWMDVRP